MDPIKEKSFYIRRIFSIVLKAGLGVAISMAIFQFSLDFFEFYLFDMRVRFKPHGSKANSVVLVMADSKTVAELSGIPNYRHHAQLIDRIAEAHPLAIAYVTPLAEVPGATDQQEVFLHSVVGVDRFYQVAEALEMKGVEGGLSLEPPLESIRLFPGPKTVDSKNFGRDGVTRRFFLSYQGNPMFHSSVAGLVNPKALEPENVSGNFTFFDSVQAYIDYQPPGSFAKLKFEQVFSGKFDSSLLRDKIVLVGDDYGRNPDHYVLTPYSREINSMTVAEMHANAIETVVRDSAPRIWPDWLNLIITILVSVLTIQVVLAVRPLRGLTLLGLVAIGFTSFSLLAFWSFSLWVKMAPVYLAIFVCYYFLIPYRLILESRRSWEYFQKNKILSEVERLKTNFISMMSHDLRTPLARIQGMTDILSKDPTSLSITQTEAVDTIRHSASDLLRFINTILNYAKIESQGVSLHLQVKDVNELVKDVIQRSEFLAKLKKIEIRSELEPLFSIYMDPDLIRQVLTNLVENAIKYSPETSRILVTSEEREGLIVIQVADQGAGIPPDELESVFMKFYRSKDAKSSPIRGSGLGLYLAKYFVELHDGRLIVESTVGQGSTFTVELPIRTKTV